jgi:hypothetical protein
MKKPDNNLLHEVSECLARHIKAESYELTVIALWILHTHVFRKFAHTPRLALLSPTPNTGKSTVFDILNSLVANPKRLIFPTAATLRNFAASGLSILIDEADNIRKNQDMVHILNYGHQRGGTIPRITGKQITTEWPVFAPVALAGIGTLPAVLLTRSIVIRMLRASPGANIVDLDINNIEQMAELAALKGKIEQWASQVNLNPTPAIPKGWDRRLANCWRVLFAIADSLNQGPSARKAASHFCEVEAHSNELLLIDIKKIFDALGTKEAPGAVIVQKLHELGDDAEADWSLITSIR